MLQLIMGFLGKNVLCSNDRWQSSLIFVIYEQTRNASFKFKTGELHKYIFYLNALKEHVQWDTSG